jgi:hypothetical protein
MNKKYMLFSLILLLFVMPFVSAEMGVISSAELDVKTEDSFFTKLISAKADLTSGELVYEFYNPYAFSLDKLMLQNEYIGAKGIDVLRTEMFILSDVTHYIPVYKESLIKQTCVNKENETSKSLEYDCSYTEKVLVSNKSIIDTEWLPIKEIPSGKSTIKIVPYWLPALGDRAVDLIPALVVFKEDTTAKSKDYVFSANKWAWLNSSYDNRFLINCSDVNTLNVPIVINGSAGFDVGLGKQIVWTNCQENLSLYFNSDTHLWYIANLTDGVAWETELGNVSSNNPTLIWDSDFVAVWHMGNGNDSTHISDSTNNSFNGEKINTFSQIDGKIGFAQHFEGVDDYVDTLLNPVNSLNYTLTMEAFVYPHEIGNYQGIMGMLTSNTAGMLGFQYENDIMNFGFAMASGGGYAWNVNMPGLNNSVWSSVSGTINVGNANTINVFLNSEQVGSPTYYVQSIQHNAHFDIGRSYADTGRYFNGVIDEVRVSKIVRSTNYFTDIYQNVLGISGYGTLDTHETNCAENLSNTTPVYLEDIECLINDSMNQSWEYTTYDINECGAENVTTSFFVQNVTCDFCTPNIENTTWTEWFNESCVFGDLMNQSSNITEYDTKNCYAITNIESDYWENITYYAYQLNGTCDFCEANLTNTTWGDWIIGTCLVTNFSNDVRYLTQYDINVCADEPNVTFHEHNATANACIYVATIAPSIDFTFWVLFIIMLVAFIGGLISRIPIIFMICAPICFVLMMTFSVLSVAFLIFCFLGLINLVLFLVFATGGN